MADSRIDAIGQNGNEGLHYEGFKQLELDFGLSDDHPVLHPNHYTSHPSGVECIEITRHMNFCLGNAMKYIWRADLKDDAIQDLEKAKFYIEQEISLRKEGL
jgi:hypothetical protein